MQVLSIMTSSFILTQRKTQTSGTSRPQKKTRHLQKYPLCPLGDTTSCLYGIGKGLALASSKQAVCFMSRQKMFTHDVVDAGEKALVLVYNGKLTDTLDSLRNKWFCEKVASKISLIKPQSLPPTLAAVKYCSLHVYLQVKDQLQNFIPGRSVRGVCATATSCS